MPEYTIRDPKSGKTIILRGDSPPTEQELEQIFAVTSSPSPTPSPERSLSGFLGNVVSSGTKAVGNAVTGLGTLGKLGSLAARTVTGDPEAIRDSSEGLKNLWQHKGAIGSAIATGAKNRYGSGENIKKTLYEDPIGAALDLSTVFGGAGLATKVGGAPKLAKTLQAVSSAANPLHQAGRAAAPVLSEAGNLAIRAWTHPTKKLKDSFGGGREIANTIQKERLLTSEGAQVKLDPNVAKADALLADAHAAGHPGIPVGPVIQSLTDRPLKTAQLDRQAGGGSLGLDAIQTRADALINEHPSGFISNDIANPLKRRFQDRAFEMNKKNESLGHQIESSLARALRSGIENEHPGIGAINTRSQNLLGAQKTLENAEHVNPRVAHALSALTGVGGLFTGHPEGIAAALSSHALLSPKVGAGLGIGLDMAGNAAKSSHAAQAALFARLFGQK